jgi:hypothetical protein
MDSAPLPTVLPPQSPEGKLCSFEENQIMNPVCGWEVSTLYPNVWQLQNGQNIRNDQYLPAFDHTTQEEYGTTVPWFCLVSWFSIVFCVFR